MDILIGYLFNKRVKYSFNKIKKNRINNMLKVS